MMKNINEKYLLLSKFYSSVEKSTYSIPHPGKIIAIHKYKEPFPNINETMLFSISIMDLLINYAYPCLSGYCKFTIQLTMKLTFDVISFTLGAAIPITFENGDLIHKNIIFERVYSILLKYIDKYEGVSVHGISVIIFMLGGVKDEIPLISEDARYNSLLECLQPVSEHIEPIVALKIQHKKVNYHSHITGIKERKSTRLKSFLVADIETILINDVHKPYAVGVMMVRPGYDLKRQTIYTNFSEDYTPYLFKSFEERSTRLLNDFILRIISIIKQNKDIKTVYFHNFSRFDGIFVIKHLALHHKMFKLKPLMRDNRIYELAVYSGNRMLFRFRDSLHLLPGSLDNLAKNLCPEFGVKGSIEHDKISLSNLSIQRESLIDYMKQDILLLGGIMHNFQALYANAYNADIEDKITIASLALSLFRSNYYNEVQFPIHIPNKNEDTFIRRGYYGGHADAYTPYGENLYYYDINSLYPFVMKEFPMPGGVPVWHSDLDSSMDLDSMFGFIQAYVECPKTMKRPFLPYRNNKDGILLFPTGEFVGVYYSEELKYARDLGYKALPICGYLFQKMESPFKDYVNSLFESRSNAKKQGNNAISYVYKNLLNSLYGRFGINPISTITEMCDKNRRDILLRKGTFINETHLREDLYMVSYHSNMETGPDYWKPPQNSAIQLAAAITACARIYMYKYISRDDCYYTDTDSIVLGNPLPEDEISSTVLGKFKLEDKILKGYFLAPKCYYYTPEDSNQDVLKYKGAGKSKITPEWFKHQYENPESSNKEMVTSNFRIDWSDLEVKKIESPVTLRIALNRKRIVVIQDQKWLDTNPIEISDLSAIDNIGMKIIRSLRKKL